ncbi:uncharacterized protein N7446_006209 [Penicillium canescens]|uniref:uncharacterized protein n=1 Tax=Penicillium canescens TaxID=5083 RepID=UPI0026DEE81D|nr:uncharacterized protein N7446_006209 [Penicillium canescens]KAJ6062089.1 hypothetical protein N7446_006209 [Penicillium canescens]
MGDQKNKDGDFYSNALLSAAKVGALSGRQPHVPELESLTYKIGGAGLLYGGAAGVIRSPNPVVHSLSCGIHCLPKERTYVSALCGGVAGGSVTKLMGGRLVPGAIIFSLLGYCGQSVFNRVDAWQMANANNSSKPLVQRMAESKWIPLRTLSDEEYRGMLGEKLLSVEAEIALLDDKIAELEKSRPVLASPAK